MRTSACSNNLRDAQAIYRDAAARGERLSQRMLARQLRGHGHRLPNGHLRLIADSIGLTANLRGSEIRFGP